MKSVMLSIQPKWCELIVNGSKTIEIRKTRPKLETPFKCYIYQTKKQKLWDVVLKGEKDWYDTAEKSRFYKMPYNPLQGKVIGEFICDEIKAIQSRGVNHNYDYCYESLNIFGNDDIAIEINAIKKSCIPKGELNKYGENKHCLYAWHISNLKIYEEPKNLSDFTNGKELPYDDWLYGIYDGSKGAKANYNSYLNVFKIKRPPQSWGYVESEIENG